MSASCGARPTVLLTSYFEGFRGLRQQMSCCAAPACRADEVFLDTPSGDITVSKALLSLSSSTAPDAFASTSTEASACGAAPPEGGAAPPRRQVDLAEAPRLLGALRPERRKGSTGNLSSLAGTSAVSTADDPAEIAGASTIGSDSPGSPRSSGTPLGFSQRPPAGIDFVRSKSFEVDLAEMPDLVIPDKETPLVSGRLAVSFRDLEQAIFAESGGPLVAFLENVMGCRDVSAGPWLDDAAEDAGASRQQLQRSQYQLPLPDDVPEVAARLLGLGKLVSSSTFTRISRNAGHIILQQSSRTEGLLYSERMRVMNVHMLEADASGGVAWRTWTRILWTKALPWTHTFIGKIIDGRVKAETKANAPKLMMVLGEAATAVNASTSR